MKLAVVLNCRAGTLFGLPPEETAREVERLFAAAGATARVALARRRTCQALLARAAQSDADALVVGGGDGTVRSAARLALQHGKTLGVLPLGTVNLLARDLGIPLDIHDAIAALAQAEPQPIDVAEVNGRIFLSVSGLGFFVEMAEAREAWRPSSRTSKWIALAGALWTALWRTPDFDIELVGPHGRRQFRTRAVLVTNNLYQDVPGPVAGRPRLDRGELAVHVGRSHSRLGMLRAVLHAARAGWQAVPAAETIRTRAITIASRRRHVRVSSDGEIDLLTTPLRYRSRAAALRVLVPRAQDRAQRPPSEAEAVLKAPAAS